MNMKTPIRTLLALVATLVAHPTASAAGYLWNVDLAGPNAWNVAANWTPGGVPGAADTVVFGALGTVPDALSVNNVVSLGTTVSALSFTHVTPAAWHVTQIPAGVTLSVTNLTVGGMAGDALFTSAAMTDAGTLTVYGNVTIGNNGATAANSGTILDLSGLSTWICAAPGGTLQVGTGNRSGANLNFAAVSNHVTMGTINFNTLSTSSTPSGTPTILLGPGTNILHVGALNLAFGRTRCTVQFGSDTGGLRLRGVGGTDADRATLAVGNRSLGGSGGTTTGTLALNGHPVDLKLNSLIIGQAAGTGTGVNIGTGVVSFDTGTIDATNISLAVTTTVTNSAANGTLNVGSQGTLIVGSGGLSLANLMAGSTHTATGLLNITNGTVICSNSITKANANPGGTGTITVTGGALRLMAGTIGSAAVPIDTLSLGDSALTLAVTGNTTNVVVTALTMTSTTNNVLHIAALPTILAYPVQFPLIRYATGSSDFQLGSLPPGYQAQLVTAAGTVDLRVTSGAITVRPLVWNGAPTGDWDTSTTNWLYLGSPTAYSPSDVVTFDDTARGSTTVNLTGPLTPGTLTVSNVAKAYTFSGTGSLAGTGFIKTGSGQLTLGNSGPNSFSGGVSLLEGTLQLSGTPDRLPTNTTVSLADVPGARLDLNHLGQRLQTLQGGGYNGGHIALGSGTLTVWGGGTFGGVISGSGSLVKTNLVTGGTLTLTNASTYSGGTVIGGFTNNTTVAVANATGSGTGPGFVLVLTNGTLTLGNGGPGGSVAAGVITNHGTVTLNRSDDFTFTNTLVGDGVLTKANTNVATVPGTNGHGGGTTINGPTTVLEPSILRIPRAGALGSGPVSIGNRGTLQLLNGIVITNPVTIDSKPSTTAVGSPNVENLADTNTLTGPLQLRQNGAQGWVFSAAAGRLLVSGTVLPMNPTNTSQSTTRPLWLRGDGVGEWRSSLIDPVGGSTNLTLRKDGAGTWILSGTNTYTGPTVVSNGTLVVNGSLAASSAVTVTAGTLAGTGLLRGAVTIDPEGTLSPGAPLGTLTISNSLTLNGTNLMEVSPAAADQVAGIGSLTLGGTLQVVVLGSLRGGEVFQLFEAASYAGDFAVYDLPTLPGALGWDYSAVPINGRLRVTGTAPGNPPVISGFSPASGGVGTSVTILGSFFTGTTAVKLGGTAALSYTVPSDSQIVFTVPAGATTGSLSVTTPDGTATSAGSFTVIPPPTLGPVAIAGTNLVLSTSTVAGGTYVLQSTTHLLPTTVWRNETTNTGTGGNVVFTAPIDPAKPQQFHRIWAY